MTSWLAELAWTGSSLQRGLLLEEAEGRLTMVTPWLEQRPPRGAQILNGLTLPGLVSAHSHAFHRALRGRTESPPGRGGDFWSWREQMYRLASGLDPDRYRELARATFGEMLLAGITTVGEFHYLHHQEDGSPYPDLEMERAVIAAAEEAGIRLTLLDGCYLQAGAGGGALQGAQLRFGDHDAAGWAARVSRIEETPTLRLGAAIHSVRAVDPASMETVAAWARERGAPLHLHLSEQPEENRACLAATGMTPTQLLDQHNILGQGTTAVHAIHLTEEDLRRLGGSGTTVCVCPTTERDLADGICPARELADAGSPLCLGSDSNAVIDIFEEARAVELDQRLSSGRRGLHSARELLDCATVEGMTALGWEGGRLSEGMVADFITLEPQSTRLAGAADSDLIERVVFAASSADVRSVVVGGREVVHQGEHLGLGQVAWELERVLRGLERSDRDR